MATYSLGCLSDVAHMLTVRPDGFDAWGMPRWRYQFTCDDAVIFAGNDVTGPVWAGEDEAARNILGFLTLRPGDIDAEFFDGYTERQLEWCESYAEELSLALISEDGGEVPSLACYRVSDGERPRSPFQAVRWLVYDLEDDSLARLSG